jgi:hypothetical protein
MLPVSTKATSAIAATFRVVTQPGASGCQFPTDNQLARWRIEHPLPIGDALRKTTDERLGLRKRPQEHGIDSLTGV